MKLSIVKLGRTQICINLKPGLKSWLYDYFSYNWISFVMKIYQTFVFSVDAPAAPQTEEVPLDGGSTEWWLYR